MFYNKKIINELELSGKTVFLRLDLNVPVDNGVITSYKRINSTLPTIKYLLDNNAKIVILSHFGRPTSIEDIESGKFSLEIVARALAAKIGKFASEISFISENKGPEVETKIASLKERAILVLENTRFNDIGSNGELINYESGCNEDLAKYWAGLCDVFVNDAYGAAHRKHASTYGIAKYQPNNAIGFLMNEELKQLTQIVNHPIRPLTVIFGGAKVSDKSKAVEATLKTADKVIISGGMAYTFLAAQGYDMGLSKVEYDFIDEAKRLLAEYPNKLVISSDFLCSPSFSDTTPVYLTKEDGLKGYMGLDIGEKSIKEFEEVINSSNSILWNGPMGVTEFSNYTKGTNAVCDAIAKRTELGAFTVIGGGDSAAAAEKLGKQDSFSWISTGGGASLVLIEGKVLAGIESINESLKKKIIIKRQRRILCESDVNKEEIVDMKSTFENVYDTIFPNGFKQNDNVIVVDIFEDEDIGVVSQRLINEIYKNSNSNVQEQTYITNETNNIEQEPIIEEQAETIVEEIVEETTPAVVDVIEETIEEVPVQEELIEENELIEEVIDEIIEEEIVDELVEEFVEELEENVIEAVEEEIIEELKEEILDEIIEEEITEDLIDEIVEEEIQPVEEEINFEVNDELNDDSYILGLAEDKETVEPEDTEYGEEVYSFENVKDNLNDDSYILEKTEQEEIQDNNEEQKQQDEIIEIEEEIIEEPTIEELVDEIIEEDKFISEETEFNNLETTNTINEEIVEEKQGEIASSEHEEEYVPNIHEVEEEKQFSKSEYDESNTYSQIESEIIQLEPEVKQPEVIELDITNVKTQKRRGLSNAAIRLKNLINNQKMNLQKIEEEKEGKK